MEEAAGEAAQSQTHHFRLVEVKKGVTDAGFTEVVLPQVFDVAGSQVATKGAFYLLSALKAEGEEE